MINSEVMPAADIITRFSQIQKDVDHVMYCPRCGKSRMNRKLVMNALSRRADVYICDRCGVEEAFEDYLGMNDSIDDWAIVRLVKGDK